MLIHKAVKVRLYPTAEQEMQLRQHAGCARFVYNWGLVRWKELYELGHKPTAFGLSNELVHLKRLPEYEWLNDVTAQVLQQSLANLGEAYKRFFKTKKGFPQFKRKGQHDAFRIPQYFEVVSEAKRIKLPKLGFVKYRQRQAIVGTVKSITVSRKGGYWFASILTEQEAVANPHSSSTVIGLDVGIANLLTTYDGLVGKHYHHSSKLKILTDRLGNLHQRVSRKQKGSKNRTKAILRLNKLYSKIANARLDTLHKLSTDISKNHAVVVVEDLRIRNMSKSASGTIEQPGTRVAQKRGLNRAILNQGWRTLFDLLVYKTRNSGGEFIIIPPMYTSQTCPSCLHCTRDNRTTQARFSCVECGYNEHADVVGAINIRRLGLM